MFETFMFIGIIFLIVALIYFNKDTRIEFDKVASFLAFLTVVTCIRIGYNSLFTLPSEIMANAINEGRIFQPWSLLRVWWEDCFFVLPIFFFSKTKISKTWFVFVILAYSIAFASGHLYAGYLWAGITLFYPYFVSYRYGIRYGFGTVMVCHVIYDMVTFCTVKLMPYILL